MYLAEVKEGDEQLTKNWSEDMSGLLVFNGLLSAIVATFLLLSFPRLSPDSGDQTVALLTHLVNVSSGAPVVSQNTPFKAPASIVRVNVMWILSLILSLCCALLTTSMQQWARVYLDYTQCGTPQKRARIREYLFEGVEKYQLRRAIGTIPFLLHISVFLFFAGLIEFLLPINTVVAYSGLGCVAAFAFIYVILTLSPILRPNCPYRTPLSGIIYILFQLSASGLFWAAKVIEGIFHGFLTEIWRRTHLDERGSPSDWPTKWQAMLEANFLTHCKSFLHGLRCRVERGAMAQTNLEAPALRWILTNFDEDKKCEDFVACMPGFFDPHEPDATSTMFSLMSDKSMSDQSKYEPILGSRLRELLKSCQPGTSPLTEEQRNNRLRVCLTSLWYCLRAYNLPENLGEPLPQYIRTNFASSEVIDWIQTEEDAAIRLLGRCFWSLVVKKLENDITSRTNTVSAATIWETAYLSSILGVAGELIRDWLGREGAIDLAIIIYLASGEFETVEASGTKWDVGEQTLRILVEGIVPSPSHDNVEWDNLPLDLVAQFRVIYSKLANAQLSGVLKERLQYISARFPPTPSVEELETETPTSGPSQNLRVPLVSP
ncbi:hypothetical protein EI94DRAFT_1722590 [Lactarius quietus]|nr:hypothetical protein EI94DRAFT_1722590 [Lactarius quietus]